MIFLNVDLSAVLELKQELEPKINAALQEAAKTAALQAHAHILELAQTHLHSSRDKYVGALSFEQVNATTWVIGLDKTAMFIEEGLEGGEMIDDMLASPKAKMAADGSRYLVVPFKHNKGPTQQTRAQTDLTNTVKSELARRKIPYGKLETDASGKPKLGLLHKFDVMKMPLKTHQGPGQGHGAVGQVRQGNTGIPFLQGIRVYQKEIKDAAGKATTVRDVMTFRIVSSKHRGSGKWIHPGLEPRQFMDKTLDWVLSEWETKIVPDILSRLDQSL